MFFNNSVEVRPKYPVLGAGVEIHEGELGEKEVSASANMEILLHGR